MMRDNADRSNALQILRQHGRERKYKSRETIFARGDTGDSMAIIESGVVRICVFGPDGKEFVLALLGPGDVIGELSVIDKRERAADVIAAGRVTLTVLSAQDMRELLYSDRAVLDYFLNLLCSRVRSANASAETYALNSLAGRLVIFFMNHGQENEDGTLSLPNLPSQSEIARLVGVARESVNRQLRAWRNDGLLEPLGSGYRVTDPVKLQESALTE
ncbi:Crp/Fnr family transcriptional regulator [Aliishimia ponticola]|uniref:Crp/Fnr family transcriptional regulator n=1 Tax=Aliishimia ponticola TaxID=2499833 RepID=A0A4S4NA13_9RHOB|nr:Crp/Fnr family transcriptional regulator [Aliishimia ponticola]THH35257.1 Crp/Fnr family transcriptional regulator [Aliishimia ponticola]